MSDELKRAALSYAARGWAVFPLAPNGKLPLIAKERGGRGVHDATTDPKQIATWWDQTPEA
ncbi:MAG: bifunctional DNA primase/polymerase, partial [Dehalococcoidia bacterium]|nr:bifunctional DNA primase/polymerase [Dehalococcoidia bacterium]